jgi:large subunit ribosomal protein L3
VFPGKRMAGQYGNKQRTVQALKVVRVDAARGLLLIAGAVPGTAGGHVIVKPTVRS